MHRAFFPSTSVVAPCWHLIAQISLFKPVIEDYTKSVMKTAAAAKFPLISSGASCAGPCDVDATEGPQVSR